MAQRRGLNATLSYPRDGKTRTYRVRCTAIQHGFELIASESQGRTERALYPMKEVPSQFSITIALVGYAEHNHFSDWLASYAGHALNPDRGGSYPDMSVSVPSRNFSRKGVPITGVEYGDHVGAIVWNRVVTFETTSEPWDSKKPRYSRYEAPESGQALIENQYFYPAGVQLSGNKAPPEGTYVEIIRPTARDVNRIQQSDDYAYDGTAISLTDSGEPDEGTS